MVDIDPLKPAGLFGIGWFADLLGVAPEVLVNLSVHHPWQWLKAREMLGCADWPPAAFFFGFSRCGCR
jgi:hypothetical protein